MLKHLRTLSKDSLIYGLGNASVSIVSFLLLPLYTRFLTPEDYGRLSMFTVYQSVAEITISFSLSSALFRYFLMSKEDGRPALSTCLVLQVAFILLFGLPLFLAARPISSTLFQSGEYANQVQIVTATALIGALTSLLYSVIRAKRKTTLFAIMQTIRTAGMAGMNILFITRLHMNFKGVLLTNLLVVALSLAFLAPILLKDFKAPLSASLAKRILIFCGPIYLVNLFAFFLNMSDRFFLNHFLSPREVGFYSFGNKLGSIVSIGIITPFSTAVLPYAFSIAKRDDFGIVFARIVKYFAVVTVCASLPIAFFSREMVLLVGGASYLPSWVVIGPTLLSGIFFGLYYALSIQLDISEKTHYATLVVLAAGTVSLLSNYLLVPWLGVLGSAASGCLSNFVLVMCMYRFGQKAHYVRHQSSAFQVLAFLVLAYIGLYWGIERILPNQRASIVMKICLLLAFPIFLLICGFFDPEEKGFIYGKFRVFSKG